MRFLIFGIIFAVYFQTIQNAPLLKDLVTPEQMKEIDGGLDKYLQLKNPDEALKPVFEKLGIQEGTEYLGNGFFGAIFKVKMQPKSKTSTQLTGRTVQRSSVVKPEITKKAVSTIKPAKNGLSSKLSEPSIIQTKPVVGSIAAPDEYKIIKIALDRLDLDLTREEQKHLVTKYHPLDEDFISEGAEFFTSHIMKDNVNKYLDNIKGIITEMPEYLFSQKNLKRDLLVGIDELKTLALKLPDERVHRIYLIPYQTVINQIKNNVLKFYLKDIGGKLETDFQQLMKELKEVI